MTNSVKYVTKPFQDNTSVVKKSAASKVSQWACRNWCQLVDLPRSGAGSNPLRWRMLSTVESLTLNPRLASAPTMRLLPQVGFSWSSVITSFSSSASTDGRPTGLILAKVHFLAIRTRNQRRVLSYSVKDFVKVIHRVFEGAFGVFCVTDCHASPRRECRCLVHRICGVSSKQNRCGSVCRLTRGRLDDVCRGVFVCADRSRLWPKAPGEGHRRHFRGRSADRTWGSGGA